MRPTGAAVQPRVCSSVARRGNAPWGSRPGRVRNLRVQQTKTEHG